MVKAGLVVASCGSIHTPALLLRSGIRCQDNVGANLRLHPATVVAARYPADGRRRAQPPPQTPKSDADKARLSIIYGHLASAAQCATGQRPSNDSAGGEPAGQVAGLVNMWQGAMMSVISRQLADWECLSGTGYGPLLSVPVAHPGLLAAGRSGMV